MLRWKYQVLDSLVLILFVNNIFFFRVIVRMLKREECALNIYVLTSSIFVADNSMCNMKLPLIYLIDCTLNDCSLIQKSLNKVCFISFLFLCETQ